MNNKKGLSTGNNEVNDSGGLTLKDINSVYDKSGELNNSGEYGEPTVRFAEFVSKSSEKELINFFKAIGFLRTNKDILIFKKKVEKEFNNISQGNSNFLLENSKNTKGVRLTPKAIGGIIVTNLLILGVAFNAFGSRNYIESFFTDNDLPKKEKVIEGVSSSKFTSVNSDSGKEEVVIPVVQKEDAKEEVVKNVDLDSETEEIVKNVFPDELNRSTEVSPEEFISALEVAIDGDFNTKPKIVKVLNDYDLNNSNKFIENNKSKDLEDKNSSVENLEDKNISSEILDNNESINVVELSDNNLNFYKGDINKLKEKIDIVYSLDSRLKMKKLFDVNSEEFKIMFKEINKHVVFSIGKFNDNIKDYEDILNFLNVFFPAENLEGSLKKHVIYILGLNRGYIVKLPSDGLVSVINNESKAFIKKVNDEKIENN